MVNQGNEYPPRKGCFQFLFYFYNLFVLNTLRINNYPCLGGFSRARPRPPQAVYSSWQRAEKADLESMK